METTALIPTVITENIDYLFWGSLPYGSLGGWLLTLLISLVAGVIASLLGLCGGIALTLVGDRVKQMLNMLIAVLRAVPILMLIFWMYFLLPVLFGINMPALVAVICVLSLVSAAYLSKSVYAGITAIAREQWYAALSLGLSTKQALRLIILPQALRMMLPSFVNQWIALIKDSSLAYVVGVAEFTFVATQINNREQIYPLEIFVMLAGGYFILCATIEWFGGYLEQRLQPPKPSTTASRLQFMR
jgi:polar amino acid transport system permease protein